MTKATAHLNRKYSSFGKFINDMYIVHTIENVEKVPINRPIKDIITESITVDTKGVDYKVLKKLTKKAISIFDIAHFC